MFSKSNIADPCAAHLDFDLREITGRWVSLNGMPAVTIYRNTSRKRGGIRLSLTYNNPQAVCDCTVYCVLCVRSVLHRPVRAYRDCLRPGAGGITAFRFR